jgi:hypothetical protein
MKKKSQKSKKSVFPLFLLIGVISVGLSVAVFQIGQPQDPRTRAQTMPSPPDQNMFDPMAPPTNCPNTAAELQGSANEQALFDAINAYRQEKNLRAIMATPQLKKSAKWYSKDLSMNNVQMPNGTDSFNRPLENRLFDCIVDLSGEFREGIAIAPSVTEALNALKSDPELNGDLLSPTADFMAIGNTGNYYVVDIASPPGSPPNPPVQPDPTDVPANPGTGANPGQGSVIPSPACLGSCPTDVPDATGGTGNQAPDSGDISPTPCVSSQLNSNNAGDDIQANHKKHKNKKGNSNGLIQQLIQLIEELLKLLGGTGGTIDPGTIDPGTTDPGSSDPNGNPC